MNKIKEKYFKLVCLLLIHRNQLYSEHEWKWYILFVLSIMEAWLTIGFASVINWFSGFDIYGTLFSKDLLQTKIIVYFINILLWLSPFLIINYFLLFYNSTYHKIIEYKYKGVVKSKIKVIIFFIICGGFPIGISILRNIFN